MDLVIGIPARAFKEGFREEEVHWGLLSERMQGFPSIHPLYYHGSRISN